MRTIIISAIKRATFLNPEDIAETIDVDVLASAPVPRSVVEDLLGMLVTGGPVVWLLLCFSLLALTVILFKLGQLIAARQRPGHAVDKAMALLQADQPLEAQMLVNGQSNPRAGVLSHALKMHGSDQYSAAEIREEALRRARLGLARQESHLRILEVIAMLAPLLGLFGTVLGMIEAFRAMESAGAQVNPAILSGGIWQALLTTAVGLAVAIPVSIAHSWFERKLEVQAGSLQNDVDVLASIVAHARKQESLVVARQSMQRAVS